MRSMKKWAIAASAALVASGSAQAASVNNIINTLITQNGGVPPAVEITAHDDGASIANRSSGSLAVGDIFTGIFRFTQLTAGIHGEALGGTNDELTAFFQIEVAEVANTTGTAGTADHRGDVFFQPTAGFQTQFGAGAMVAIFADSSPDLGVTVGANQPNVAAAINLATNRNADGTPDPAARLWAIAGFDGWVPGVSMLDSDSEFNGLFFNATNAVLDIPTIIAAGETTDLGDEDFLLNLVGSGFEADAFEFVKLPDGDASGHFVGTDGNLRGAHPDDPFPVTVDQNVSFAVIPTPAAFGIGLMGLGMIGLRRPRRA